MVYDVWAPRPGSPLPKWQGGPGCGAHTSYYYTMVYDVWAPRPGSPLPKW